MVSAAEQTALAADKPLFLVKNILRDINIARPGGPEWRDGATGNWPVGLDVSDPAFPAIRAQDGKPNLVTKPVNTGLVAYTLIFDVTTNPGGVANLLDAFVIGNHNFGDLERSVTITITVEFSASDTFAAPTTIGTFVNPTDNFRLASYNLNSFTTYSATRSIRITIVSDTALLTTPKIGQFFLGGRRQMGHKADRPVNEFSYRTGQTSVVLQTGNRNNFVNFRGQSILTRSWRPQDGVDDSGLDDTLTLKNIINDLRGTFVYVEDPSTGVQEFQFTQLSDPSLALIKGRGINYFDSTQLVMEEQGAPFIINEQGVT